MISRGPWSDAPKAAAFAEREFQVCVAARFVEDARTYWVAAGGGPMYTVLLARRLYAPNAIYVTEDGIVAAEPVLPLDPVMTVVGERPSFRALQWTTMNGIGDQCATGYMDYGILNTLQLDPHGNINSTWVGRYPERGKRINGPGGADTIAAQCRRVILLTDHQKRKFVEKVDFISSAGFLDGSPGARERAGLPRGTGPWAVVTNWAVFDFDESTRRLRLRAIAPFVTLDQVLGEMSFTPVLGDTIETIDAPTERELDVFRAEMDTRGQFTDASDHWIIREDDRWTMVAKEKPAGAGLV
jgi:glutaconate CoA-transferase, subunit B